jgi:hypothetical protein
MFHKSHLGEHADHFPHDLEGHIPQEGDDWRTMKFDHGEMNPHEDGITEEERAKRLDYLDEVWWPETLARVEEERSRQHRLYGESFFRRWEEIVNQAPPVQHGFEPKEFD